LGVGRRSDGSWHPTEDFRWPKALEGFLNELSRRGQERVDLVIVGDFLELWQPPPEIGCKGITADLGCTVDEMEALSRLVAGAHSDALSILRAFAERGENRLHVIPGNHDATLRYERVWRPFADALQAGSGRINLVTIGIWSSPDGRVVAEHGHQIGIDVNRYETWPRVVRRIDGTDYVIRPWGELFVQKLFNEQEELYPIIDNLSPETAGARYRAADRGLWNSTKDVARMLMFNLWETSPTQKTILLGEDSSGRRQWNLRVARNMGANLFLKSLTPEDPLRKQIETGGGDAEDVKAELDAMARDPARLPDEVVLHLCDLIADRGQKPLCIEAQLGSLTQHALVAKSRVLARHLRARQAQFRDMEVFIYGHTHQYEKTWKVPVNDLMNITVANTGAFQRLVDEPGFLRRLNGMTPEHGLRTMTVEQLAPCYTAVIIATADAEPEVYAWHMPEDGRGILVSPGDGRCK
jgi:UDP-2,3-diacylglucosamine pyrophosphatase LpxH